MPSDRLGEAYLGGQESRLKAGCSHDWLPHETAYFLTRRWQWMSHAGKIHAA